MNSIKYLPGEKDTNIHTSLSSLNLEEHGVTCVKITSFIQKETVDQLWAMVRNKHQQNIHYKVYEMDPCRFDLWDIPLLNESIPKEIDELVLSTIKQSKSNLSSDCTLVRKSFGILPVLTGKRV